MTLEASPPGFVTSAWHAFVTRERFSVTLGCAISVFITLWLARTLHVPTTPHSAGILMQQPAWPIAIGLACVALIGCTILTSVIAGHVHFEGGLFCACFGLAALSYRLGPTRFALFNSSSPSIYVSMAFELIVLFVAVTIVWLIVRAGANAGWLAAEPMSDPAETDEPLDQRILATAAQVLLTILLMMLLSQTDNKVQALASIGIASWIAALAAHHFVPTRPSAWFWVGPLIVGLIGYVGQYFSPSDWMIGDARGFFAPMARPMPLDYASMGVAGALLGYWTSLHWHHARLLADTEEEE